MFKHDGLTEIISTFPRGQVVLYLLKSEKNVLIDTGPKETATRDMLPVLKSRGMTFNDITYIINTHGHFDHTGGNHEVKAGGNAKICIHELEKDQVANRQQYIKDFFKPVVTDILGEKYFESEWEDYAQIAGPETEVDLIIEDNDLFALGPECHLRVIHLPGHTPGSVGILWENEGVLFSGDSLPGLHDCNGGIPILSDLEAYRKSIQRVKEIHPGYMMMSHEFRSSLNKASWVLEGKEIDAYLETSLRFIDCFQEAISRHEADSAERSFPEFYDSIVSELPADMGFRHSGALGTNLFCGKTIYFALKKAGAVTWK